MEVYAFLVGATVFKTGETEYLGLAGSIPVHLRHRMIRHRMALRRRVTVLAILVRTCSIP
jgi:hypothetical protein